MIYNKELTLNSLLVKHQNGNHDWGKIVLSSHNRNSEDQEVISVLDSPRREAIL